ncbi:sulfite exporter TauE/SafE family protein [Thermaurantiacus sp.]
MDGGSAAEIGILLAAGLWAGLQNALAGGGSFVTLPALMLTGLDARVANLTSTIALFPGQITTALANRQLTGPVGNTGFRLLLAISLVGGVLGAWLLLQTPTGLFAAMLPWLVLAATLLFARGAFGRPLAATHLARGPLLAAQALISVYGGYFGGGIGFLMLALFTVAGATVKAAQANKNALAAAMNLSGAVVFAASGEAVWQAALTLGLASMAGGYLGARLIAHVPDRAIKRLVVAIGLALFAGLLWRG